MRKTAPVLYSLVVLAFLAGCGKQEAPRPAVSAGSAREEGASLLSAGEKISLPDGGWFTWRFAEKPKLGTPIAKVQVFDKAGAQVTAYEVIGEYGMPSMRYHDSGPVKFQLNKKGDYLLPVNIVMAGEWELKIRIMTGKEKIYEGAVLFTI
ncbi:MAG: hypothetical protein NDI60_01455 [Elusimicrobiales bacterium]|nr:hypothetical protein [Elusimicrobiales bacterium]